VRVVLDSMLARPCTRSSTLSLFPSHPHSSTLYLSRFFACGALVVLAQVESTCENGFTGLKPDLVVAFNSGM
jgi:hypothetical protein